LILFDNEEVVSMFFFDYVASGVDLGMQGIGGDYGALDIERGQEKQGHGDFVGFFADLYLSDSDALLVEEGAEQMDFGSILPAGALESFSINGDSLVRSGLHQPLAKAEFYRINVCGLKNAAKSWFRRGQEIFSAPVKAGT